MQKYFIFNPYHHSSSHLVSEMRNAYRILLQFVPGVLRPHRDLLICHLVHKRVLVSLMEAQGLIKPGWSGVALTWFNCTGWAARRCPILSLDFWIKLRWGLQQLDEELRDHEILYLELQEPTALKGRREQNNWCVWSAVRSRCVVGNLRVLESNEVAVEFPKCWEKFWSTVQLEALL